MLEIKPFVLIMNRTNIHFGGNAKEDYLKAIENKKNLFYPEKFGIDYITNIKRI